MFAYGAGLLFSQHKDVLIMSMKSNYVKWLFVICIGFLVCLGTYLLCYGHFKTDLERVGAFVFEVMSVFFAYMVVLLTMKIQIGNKTLEWLESNLFPLYISEVTYDDINGVIS